MTAVEFLFSLTGFAILAGCAVRLTILFRQGAKRSAERSKPIPNPYYHCGDPDCIYCGKHKWEDANGER